MAKITRKQFITTALLGAGAASGMAIFQHQKKIMTSKHNYDQAFGLARSLKEEHHYQPLIEGRIPDKINGTLYRNGPGLFEREGYRKSNILDGDGMVQAFQFRNGAVTYRNRFVRTKKWLEEERAGRYLYNTWTTRRPGGMLKNAFMQGEFRGQAGVTVRIFNGRLYAFDESSLPYELDPDSLETLRGEIDFGVHFENVNTLFAAHNKVDARTGEWIQFGLENGPRASIQVSIFGPQGDLLRKRRIKLPFGTYMHDFFVSENYIVFNCQPAIMNPISFVLGLDSYVESLRWKNDQGSTFLILDKGLKKEPIFLKTDAVFMWHSLNTFEVGDEIFGYFCGYDEPDHFIGDHAQTFEIMKDPAAIADKSMAQSPGSLRLVRINVKERKITSDLVADDPTQTFEFPVINEAYTSYQNKYGYLVSGHMMGAFHHKINRVDIQSGKSETFDFGVGHYCGEPIFVAASQQEAEGWLMTLVFDQHTDKSYLAILRAEAVADGPLAKIYLNHHSPMSFHGTWYAA